MKILSNDQYLKRSNKNRRRKVKEKDNNSFVNRLVNVLIRIVGALIIISMTLILTNSDLKNNVRKPDEQSAAVITEGNEQANNNTKNEEQAEEEENEGTTEQQESGNEEQQSNEDEGNDGQEEGEGNGNDESASLEVDMQFITTVATEDPNVEVAFIDSRWTPYPTAQTGTHINAFDSKHIDYQEKLKLLYRDTGFTEDTSILWSIRNASGDAVAVISAKNKTNIFRLTMKWIDGQGWQTILVEQLYSLDGAY